MNTLIQQFVKDYIYNIQNIPFHKGQCVLTWFEEETLNEIFSLAKNLVSKHLTGKNCGWIIERSAFADDIEKLVLLSMGYFSLRRILDANTRNARIKEDNRFEGLWTDETLLAFKSACDGYEKSIDLAFEDIIERAEKSPEKPLVK